MIVCTECGQEIRPASDLEELFAQVDTTARRTRTRADKNNESYWAKAAEKWDRWRDALAEVIKEKRNEKSENNEGGVL